MKDSYDFAKGKRGAIEPMAPGKTRITIRIDDDILNWFREHVHVTGGGNYQTLINQALREYVQSRREPLEDTLRRVVREELASARPKHNKNKQAASRST
jgi:metal-responsive CopG/Arc/MetJ family transcriptional regulator